MFMSIVQVFFKFMPKFPKIGDENYIQMFIRDTRILSKSNDINSIYDGFEAETRKAQSSFQILKSRGRDSENEPDISLPMPQHHN